MKWQNVREKLKPRDRYYEHYERPEGFWCTLDPRVVAWTYSIPGGLILRVLYSILGNSNRYEPMPIGNNKRIINLWANWPAPIRYFLWRTRNPFEDLKKFYLGFGHAKDENVIWYQVTEHFGFWLVDIDLPFFIPFPYWKRKIGRWQFMIGWKQRGVLSVTIRRR